MNEIERAILLAAEAHGADSWGALPYLTHLALVAQAVADGENAGREAVAAAWLHDVLEDHPQFEWKIKQEFPQLLPTLRILTRDPGIPYLDYVNSIVDSGDQVALAVKIADLLTNLGNHPPRPELAERYRKALKLISMSQQNGSSPLSVEDGAQ